jgi:hypothetical protein
MPPRTREERSSLAVRTSVSKLAPRLHLREQVARALEQSSIELVGRAALRRRALALQFGREVLPREEQIAHRRPHTPPGP